MIAVEHASSSNLYLFKYLFVFFFVVYKVVQKRVIMELPVPYRVLRTVGIIAVTLMREPVSLVSIDTTERTAPHRVLRTVRGIAVTALWEPVLGVVSKDTKERSVTKVRD